MESNTRHAAGAGPQPILLSEAAALAGVSAETIRRAVDYGFLRAQRTVRGVRVMTADDVRDWMERRRLAIESRRSLRAGAQP